jgi:hypothetical protein
MYTKSEYDSFRPAYNDYDFDMDNYGYDYWDKYPNNAK